MSCNGINFNAGFNNIINLSGSSIILSNVPISGFLSPDTVKTISFLTQGVYVDENGDDITGSLYQGFVLTLSSIDNSIVFNVPATPSMGITWGASVSGNEVNITIPPLTNNQCSYVFNFSLQWLNGSVSINIQVYDVDTTPNTTPVSEITGTLTLSMSQSDFYALDTWSFVMSSQETFYLYPIVGITSS